MKRISTLELRTLPAENLVQVKNTALKMDYVLNAPDAYTKEPSYVEFPNGSCAMTEYTVLENVKKLSVKEIKELDNSTLVLATQVQIYEGLVMFITELENCYSKPEGYMFCDAIYSFE